jgi:hypothetical protein
MYEAQWLCVFVYTKTVENLSKKFLRTSKKKKKQLTTQEI